MRFKKPYIPIPAKSEIFYSKIIPRFDKTGKYQVGTLKFEVKELLRARFIQITQEKLGFAGAPSKVSCVTFDYSDSEIKKILQEALDIFNNVFNNINKFS